MKATQFLVTIVLLAGSACAGCGAGTRDVDAAQPSLDSLVAIVQDLIAHPACTDVSRCRSIAFGSKPCGGPWSYLVYSVENADSGEVARVVTQYNDREAQLNQEEGRDSDCSFVSPPQLDCVNKQCVAIR